MINLSPYRITLNVGMVHLAGLKVGLKLSLSLPFHPKNLKLVQALLHVGNQLGKNIQIYF